MHRRERRLVSLAAVAAVVRVYSSEGRWQWSFDGVEVRPPQAAVAADGARDSGDGDHISQFCFGFRVRFTLGSVKVDIRCISVQVFVPTQVTRFQGRSCSVYKRKRGLVSVSGHGWFNSV
ncbi:uncharacterized protein LOC118491349 [Helianthus annuus]|uniref:uncharacterized protein LOC118491349 n=1 Tax=Helianthus annuus TaxID=4232 RepID=UPI0016533440|nr:uncharacterized protein LOC118491349 [Helianthus annuus]